MSYAPPFQAKNIAYGSRDVPYKFAAIDGLTNGSTVVAAVTGKKINVHCLYANAAVANTCRFESAATTKLTGDIGVGTTAGMQFAFNPAGHFKTAAGEALTIALSGSNIRGFVVYSEEP